LSLTSIEIQQTSKQHFSSSSINICKTQVFSPLLDDLPSEFGIQQADDTVIVAVVCTARSLNQLIVDFFGVITRCSIIQHCNSVSAQDTERSQ